MYIKRMKYKLFLTLAWAVLIFLYYFVMEKHNAPEWALDLEAFLGAGILLVLLNQTINFDNDK